MHAVLELFLVRPPILGGLPFLPPSLLQRSISISSPFCYCPEQPLYGRVRSYRPPRRLPQMAACTLPSALCRLAHRFLVFPRFPSPPQAKASKIQMQIISWLISLRLYPPSDFYILFSPPLSTFFILSAFVLFFRERKRVFNQTCPCRFVVTLFQGLFFFLRRRGFHPLLLTLENEPHARTFPSRRGPFHAFP